VSHRDEAFQAFYLTHLLPLRRLAYRLTGSTAEAEELAQDAMVRTYRAWRRLDSRGRPELYVRKVLMNRHRSVLRRALVERRHAPAAEDSRQAGTAEDSMALLAELATLPIRQRQALVLHYFEERRQTEIAEILGCPSGTVNSLIFRGLKTLRERLSEADAPSRGVR
jgi:RNA polymerase sigma-70 factor (sigma-E family)